MPLSEQAWRAATIQVPADTPALGLVEASLPATWMRMSPHALMQGAAVLAMHYDRARMAEAIRTRVIFNEHPELMPQNMAELPREVQEAFRWVGAQVELMVLTLADQIENGAVGHAH